MTTDERYDVFYKIPSMTGDQIHVRTYKNAAEAEIQMADIKGYEGVTGCYMLPHVEGSNEQT